MMKININKLKQDIILASHAAGEGHVASAFSILDLLWVLYDQVMVSDLRQDRADRFVLSKGHASLALYAVLAEKGYFAPNELSSFCKFDSILGGHPDSTKCPGVEASTGSLGHGLPIAVGLALGSKIKSMNNRIFCLVGDGECNEGTVWESALVAAHHQLNNLCVIVDYNHSTDRALKLGDLSAKFSSFGWHVIDINGHDHDEIYVALQMRKFSMPVVVIAETIKGCGIARMENQPAWHHRSPSKQEVMEMLRELS